MNSDTSSSVTENRFFNSNISAAISILAWPISYVVKTGFMKKDEEVATKSDKSTNVFDFVIL